MSKQNTGTRKEVAGERRPGDGRGSVQASATTKSQVADRKPAQGGSKTARSAQMPERRVAGRGSARSGQQARPRPRAVAPQRNTGGFRIRPLDLGLVLLGLVVVGLIVWSALGNNQAPSASVPTNVAGVPTATTDPSFPTPLPVGATAPDFSLPAPDGQTYSLSQYKGKVVMLELFAPWCPHCQNDAPIINEVYEKYKDRVQFLAVSASPWSHTLEEDRAAQKTPTPISMDDITWFRDTFKVPFPMLFDKDVKAGESYGLAFYPTIYIISKDGKVVSEPAGAYVWENGNPVSTRSEAISVEYLSRMLDEALK